MFLVATIVSASSDNSLGLAGTNSRVGAGNNASGLNVNVDLGVNIAVDADSRTISVVNYNPAATTHEGVDVHVLSRSHITPGSAPMLENDTRIRNIRTGEEIIHTSMTMPLTTDSSATTMAVRNPDPAHHEPEVLLTVPPAGRGACPGGQMICTGDDGYALCYFGSFQTCADGIVCPLTNPNRCGSECYAKDQYVCHGDFLCPIETPDLAVLDGKRACYSGQRYNFDGHRLVERTNFRTAALRLPLDCPVACTMVRK